MRSLRAPCSSVGQRLQHCTPSRPAALFRPAASSRVPVHRSGPIARSAVDDSLRAVLRDELKFEKENYRKDESLLADVPSGFELDMVAGKNCFFLLKVSQWGNCC